MRSHGLKPLYKSGRTSRTEFQNAVVAGSNQRGPHVVMESLPPRWTASQSAWTPVRISGTKKIPNTQTTASKSELGRRRSSMSPTLNSKFRRPRFVAFDRSEEHTSELQSRFGI